MIGEFDGNKVIVTDSNSKSLLVSRNFGEKYSNYLILSPYEIAYLKEQKSLEIKYEKKKLSYKRLIEILSKKTKKNFLNNYSVYKDIRSKGYVVKTGLKFGFDFRIYPKGKKISEEHTQYVIEVIPENQILRNNQISKSVRMANSLNTDLILAIVDNELNISYYQITRHKF